MLPLLLNLLMAALLLQVLLPAPLLLLLLPPLLLPLLPALLLLLLLPAPLLPLLPALLLLLLPSRLLVAVPRPASLRAEVVSALIKSCVLDNLGGIPSCALCAFSRRCRSLMRSCSAYSSLKLAPITVIGNDKIIVPINCATEDTNAPSGAASETWPHAFRGRLAFGDACATRKAMACEGCAAACG